MVLIMDGIDEKHMTLSSCILGECMFMCPKKEIDFRNEHRLIHILEATDASLKMKNDKQKQSVLVGDPMKMVKEYTRSAAGRDHLCASLIRPTHILLQTVDYLLSLFSTLRRTQVAVVYSFVSDRLRAVRQDMILQQLNAKDTVAILQRMIPFYLQSDYICKSSPVSTFDWKLHSTQLEECFARWSDAATIICQNSLDVKSAGLDELVISSSILRCTDNTSLNNLFKWRSHISTDLWNLLLSIILCIRSSDYSGFFNRLSLLPKGFIRSSLVDSIRIMRMNAIITISIAYKCGPSKISVQSITRWIGSDSIKHTEALCRLFSKENEESIVDNNVIISRIGSYRPSTPFDDMLLYKCNMCDIGLN